MLPAVAQLCVGFVGFPWKLGLALPTILVQTDSVCSLGGAWCEAAREGSSFMGWPAKASLVRSCPLLSGIVYAQNAGGSPCLWVACGRGEARGMRELACPCSAKRKVHTYLN